MFRKLPVLLLALVIGASASVAYANHSWGGYHWARTSNPFTLKLGDNVSTGWKGFLKTTSDDWSKSEVLDTTIVPGTALRSRSPNKDCSPVSGTAQVCNKAYGNNGWLGIAQIWASGFHITQGTVKMNDTYFNTATYNTPAWRNLVMCQEVGHIFGLDHQDENFNNVNLGTCMDYTNAPAGGFVKGFDYGPSNEKPNPHDYEELGIIYAHPDSFTTISATKATGASALAQNGDFENASEWGKAIRYSSDGKPSFYVRDLGNRQKIFTFVIWAKE
jgi:hypothetical protein